MQQVIDNRKKISELDEKIKNVECENFQLKNQVD
jgi:hypothetical protein